jgi:tRNA nucleotidyltransferase (CCA-adding enzyme)
MHHNLQKSFNDNIAQNMRDDIVFIIEKYLHLGYECWIVGGPVRDLLFGLKPKDIDFTTNCPLEITKTLFDHVICTGEDHGTLTIHLNGENYEITRYRNDVSSDGRRATIEFSDSITGDLIRRDFTINAMAFNPLTNEFVDVMGGLDDINNKKLRFVGNTIDRIREDNLRFLRFVRFKLKLGLCFDEKTVIDAKTVFDVSKLSLERVYSELNNIFSLPELTSDDKTFIINSLCDVMDFDFINHNKQMSNIILTDMINTNSLIPLVYHNGWCPEFKLPISFRKIVSQLKFLDSIEDITPFEIKKVLSNVSKDFELTEIILEFHRYFHGNAINNHIELLNIIKNSNCPIMIKDLKVNGVDLINMGFSGKDVGLLLNLCLDMVYKQPDKNSFEFLVGYISTHNSFI